MVPTATCIAVVVFTALAAGPDTPPPSGVVVDAAGKPVAGATVEFIGAGDPVVMISDQDGGFRLGVDEPLRIGFALLGRSADGRQVGHLHVRSTPNVAAPLK